MCWVGCRPCPCRRGSTQDSVCRVAGCRPDRAYARPVDTVTGLLLDQLEFYLDAHLFPRLEGLGDEEFFWAPAPGAWSVVEGPAGWEMQQVWPEPDPPPVTTIAWRLAHIAASNIGTRANAFFGDHDVPDAENFNALHAGDPPLGRGRHRAAARDLGALARRPGRAG